MEHIDETELLKSGALELGVELSEAQLSAFHAYLAELLKWNARVNLTSVTQPREIVLKHFLDSIALCRLLPDGPLRAADIGSGAGFPGLAIKIAVPRMILALIEPSHKKAAFLKAVSRLLALKDVAVLESRVEAILPADVREPADVIFSRAFRSPAELLPLARPLLKAGGFVALSLGPGMEKKIPAGWEILREETITLPFSDYKRTLVKIVSRGTCVRGRVFP